MYSAGFVLTLKQYIGLIFYISFIAGLFFYQIRKQRTKTDQVVCLERNLFRYPDMAIQKERTICNGLAPAPVFIPERQQIEEGGWLLSS